MGTEPTTFALQSLACVPAPRGPLIYLFEWNSYFLIKQTTKITNLLHPETCATNAFFFVILADINKFEQNSLYNLAALLDLAFVNPTQ